MKENYKDNDKDTRYIVIGYSRSGTTVVHLVLAGHPNATALNDEMRIEPFFTKGISTFTYGNDLLEEKERAFSVLFDALTSLRATPDTKARGLKIACNFHKHAREFVSVLQSHLKDIKVIIIKRNDLVAQYGSAMHGKKSGVMHSWYKGSKTLRVQKIRISKWRFIAYCHNVFRMYAVLDDLKSTHDVLEIQYEDLLRDQSSLYAKIFGFLGLPVLEPTWLRSKKVLPSAAQYIKNYESLLSLLNSFQRGTLPAPVLFYARLLAHLSWRLKRFIPRMKRPFLPQNTDEAGVK